MAQVEYDVIIVGSGAGGGMATNRLANAYIERFNRTARHEWLDLHRFDSLDQARQLATQWIWEYNNVRPNTAIGGVPPRRLMMAA